MQRESSKTSADARGRGAPFLEAIRFTEKNPVERQPSVRPTGRADDLDRLIRFQDGQQYGARTSRGWCSDPYALAMMSFAKRQKLPSLFIAFAVGLVWALVMGLTLRWQVAAADGLVMLTALAGTLLLYRRLAV